MTKKTTAKKAAPTRKPVPAQPVHDSIYERERAFQIAYRTEQQLAEKYWPFQL